jgi:hypothetical protein
MQDQIKDQNPRALFHLQKQEGAPEWAKSASIPAPDDLKGLSNAAFACPQTRSLPVHTKESCWQSAAYYWGQDQRDPDIETRLKAAARALDMAADLEWVESQLQTRTKSASAPRYALNLIMEEGQEQGFYPLGDDEQLVESADALRKDAHDRRLPVECLRDASVELLKEARARDLEDQMPAVVIKWGEERIPDPVGARVNINLRKCASTVHADLYEDLYLGWCEELEKAADYRERDQLTEKWAELLVDLDRLAGVERYHDMQPHPYAVLNAGPTHAELEKVANQTLFLGETMVPARALVSVPEAEVRKYFRKDAAARILGIQKLASADTWAANRDLGELDEELGRELLRLTLRHGE